MQDLVFLQVTCYGNLLSKLELSLTILQFCLRSHCTCDFQYSFLWFAISHVILGFKMSALFSCYHAVHSQCKVLCLARRAIHLKITCYLLNLVFLFTLTLNTHLDLMISFQFISTAASGQLLFTSFWIFQCVHSGESVHLITAALRIHISRIIQVLKIF